MSLYLRQHRLSFIDVARLRVCFIGDSLTNEPLYRRAVDQILAPELGGYEFVGNRGIDNMTGGIIGDLTLKSWEHSGVLGDTIGEVTARVASLAATLGVARFPHIICLTIGTNNVSQLNTLGSIQSDLTSLLGVLRSTFPNSVVILSSIPTWRSGSASGVDWEAKRDLRDAYVASLPAIASGFSDTFFVDTYQGQTLASSHPPQEIQSDGVHPVEAGYRRAGIRMAQAILRIVGLRRQRRRPLIVQPRPAQAAISIVTTNTDRVVWAPETALTPEAESFAFTCWFRPASLAAGTRSIAGMSASFTNGWALSTDGDGVTFNLASSTPVFSGSGGGYSDGLLTAGEDYHFAVLADKAENRIGFCLNGQTVVIVDLVATSHPSANWAALATSNFYLGKFVVDGAPGLVKDVAFYKGSGAPTIHDLSEFGEQTYADGVYWSALEAAFRVDEGTGSVGEAAGATGSGALTGATWTTW